jgi:hypothetical protein
MVHTKKAASLGFEEVDLKETTTQVGNRLSAWTVVRSCKAVTTNVHTYRNREDKYMNRRVVVRGTHTAWKPFSFNKAKIQETLTLTNLSMSPETSS